jgi:hypothetical protein
MFKAGPLGERGKQGAASGLLQLGPEGPCDEGGLAGGLRHQRSQARSQHATVFGMNLLENFAEILLQAFPARRSLIKVTSA